MLAHKALNSSAPTFQAHCWPFLLSSITALHTHTHTHTHTHLFYPSPFPRSTPHNTRHITTLRIGLARNNHCHSATLWRKLNTKAASSVNPSDAISYTWPSCLTTRQPCYNPPETVPCSPWCPRFNKGLAQSRHSNVCSRNRWYKKWYQLLDTSTWILVMNPLSHVFRVVIFQLSSV